MDNGIAIAASGLSASMAEIQAASENIANSQTVGYSAETAQLAALPGGSANGVGDGVQVTSIAQVTNAMLSANNQQAQGSLSSLSSLQQVLTGIENVFPLGQGASSSSTTTSANTSIAGQLSTFWSSWDSVAQNPSGSASRTQIVNEAQGITASFNEASTQLGQIATNTATQLGSDVAQVNTLLTQAASLNGSIVETSGGGASPNQLTDQLNNVLGQLSSLAGVSVQMQKNGTAQVYIAGINVVQGAESSTLATTETTTGSTTTYGIAAYSSPADAAAGTHGVATTVNSGAIAGLLSGLNQSLPQFQGQLDAVANDFALTVNTQLAQGYTSAGVPGQPLFVENGNPVSATVPATASGISVNAAVTADPNLIAAGGGQALEVGGVLAGGTVGTAETLTIAKSGAAVTYTTSAGESLAAVAAGLNAQFSSAGLAISAGVTNGGTQLDLASTGSETLSVTSNAAGAGTTGLGGPTAGVARLTAAIPLGANDASNAQAMAELGTAPTVAALAQQSGVAVSSADVGYQNLVEGIGSAVQNANTQVTAQTSVANQAQQALQAVTGVNTDVQLTQLMQYQSSYQASAKVVTVIDSAMQALLAAV